MFTLYNLERVYPYDHEQYRAAADHNVRELQRIWRWFFVPPCPDCADALLCTPRECLQDCCYLPA